MAAAEAPSCCQHFRPRKLKAWPGPASVSRMEVLAREDIDQAVHMILFRENYVVKRLDTYLQHLEIFKKRRKEMLYKKWVENVAEPLQRRITEKVTLYRRVEKTKQVPVPLFAGPLFRRQQEADKKRSPHDGAENRYSTQEREETERGSPCVRRPQFPSALSCRPLRGCQEPSLRSRNVCRDTVTSPENLTCAEKKPLPSDPSQMVFERQFRSSRLSREPPGAAKKVLGTQQQRPRSWAAGDHRQRRGVLPMERRAMTAEVLGKHLVSLQKAARPPSAFYLG